MKGVFKCFADYLFLIMKEKISACGPEDDSIFVPTVEVCQIKEHRKKKRVNLYIFYIVYVELLHNVSLLASM